MTNNNFNTPAQVLKANINTQSSKTSVPMPKIILSGILAGMYIGFGAAASNVVMHNISNVGIARLLGGCVFPVGLIMIVLLGGELFTGDCLIVMAAADKKCTVGFACKLLVTVWFANLAGGLIVSGLVMLSGQTGYSAGLLGAYTIKVAYSKAAAAPAAAVSSGIMCNIFVCAAVLMAAASKDIAGKIFAVFFPIMAFVLCGFEHCVANMYYIPAGIMAKSKYAELFSEIYEISREELDSVLNLKNFFINSFFVTLGNILGGMIFIGAALYYINKKNIDAAD